MSETDFNAVASQICALSKQFYEKNWCCGSAGGLSIKDDDKIYITPSGVQKELMRPNEICVMENDEFTHIPAGLKPSDCTPLFKACYDKTAKIKAVIHTHSINAILISLLYDKVFEISNIEQIKALPVDLQFNKNLKFSETLKIPIIENKDFEHQLYDDLVETMEEYPDACAVIVRRHGLFVWGPTIEKTKIYNESIDYLMEVSMKMYKLGIPSNIALGEEKNYIKPLLL
ncbi:hypothetical protein KAFR_0E02000 [Kazachstania africana CBS 2517]|uniref:Class II aldolase/adducin N-terminal domain-containing protein n=1 Tax=Kazachstania africana (strain ATCC 22294 / BCRC 22015 / CBS 2517 / CECT 1963 / NBRC 1671 / NRRL Y-8276) TaxID=1071382 RepID=H2AVF3_KAZAF|nr:hypothetical protein KAFR_0E02000 [Kazachstania africana CBS 2517]CCF58353.1 hypothetical protein KAFR_0E02000 [Kazachstania africana CBS 2517]